MKAMSLIMTLMLVPALLCAQTAPAKTAKPAVKKAAAVQAEKAAPAAAVQAEKAAPAAAVQAEKAAPAADPFEEAMGKLKSADAAERRQAAATLAQLRNPKGAPALVAALDDPAPGVRQSAEDALGLMIWRDASPKLAEMLTKDPDANVRQQAAISLSYIMDPRSGPSLVEALKDDSQPVRYAALHTLGVIKYAPAEDQVLQLLSSEDPNMRRGAIAALAELKSSKAAGAIAAALGDKDQYVKIEAIKALGIVGGASAAPELLRLLEKSEPPGVRVEAALALSRMGMGDGLMTAYEFVKSPELSLRSKALNVIAAVGDARSLQFIDELYKAEQDPAAKGMLDFTRQRISARLNQK